MSLILEALKKSEAERRLGHVPGLLDQGPLQRHRRGTSPLRWIALLALVMGVAGAAFWLGQREVAAPESAPSATLTPSAPAAELEPEIATPSEQSSPGTESAPAAPAARANPAPAEAAPSRLPRDPGFASIERESRAQMAAPLPAPPASPPIEAAAPAITVDAPGAVPTATPASSSPPTSTGIDSPPPLSSLGAEARGRLPPFKVSMHVYTEDPAGRVVIIDGRRLREGETVSEGVRLTEIRRDGSVLEIGGRQLLLARP